MSPPTLFDILALVVVLVAVLGYLQWTSRGPKPTYRHDTYSEDLATNIVGDVSIRLHWRVTRNDSAELLEVELRIHRDTIDLMQLWHFDEVLAAGYRFADQEAEEPHVIIVKYDSIEANGDHVWQWRSQLGSEYLARNEARNRWG